MSRWTALMWNQSQTWFAEDGSGTLAVAVRHVIGGVPLEQHPAGPDVDLLHHIDFDLLVSRTADRRSGSPL